MGNESLDLSLSIALGITVKQIIITSGLEFPPSTVLPWDRKVTRLEDRFAGPNWG